MIGHDELKKAPGYVEQVINFLKPTDVNQLRQFQGLVNFQRKFIPHCSEVAQPLSCLSGPKKKKITWTEEMEQSFNKLRILMREDLLLSFQIIALMQQSLNNMFMPQDMVQELV